MFTSVALGWNVCPSVEPAGRGGLSWPKFICDFIYRPLRDRHGTRRRFNVTRTPQGATVSILRLDGERDTRQDAGGPGPYIWTPPRVKPIRRVNVNTTAQLSKSKHPRMQIRKSSKKRRLRFSLIRCRIIRDVGRGHKVHGGAGHPECALTGACPGHSRAATECTQAHSADHLARHFYRP